MNATSETKNRPNDGGGETMHYRPRLSFYHPNARGTGSALCLELHPAHDSTEGSIMATLANQLTIGERRGTAQVFPRFDWEKKLTVKLGFDDLCRILQVLRGETESLEDGKGLYHRSPSFSTRIVMRHLLEPTNAYSFELYRTSKSGEDTHGRIIIGSPEALGLCESIAGSMSVITFGIPMVIPHDTSAYRREVKEAQNAAQRPSR